MPDLGDEFHFGWFERIVDRKVQVRFEETALAEMANDESLEWLAESRCEREGVVDLLEGVWRADDEHFPFEDVGVVNETGREAVDGVLDELFQLFL